jgi:hypothetical protein
MFSLNIECSRDIDELHINFSDGTSSVVSSGDGGSVDKKRDNKSVQTSGKSKNEEKKSRQPRSGDLLDLDTDFGSVSQEVVQKPNVDVPNRPISVDPTLQNLDI